MPKSLGQSGNSTKEMVMFDDDVDDRMRMWMRMLLLLLLNVAGGGVITGRIYLQNFKTNKCRHRTSHF